MEQSQRERLGKLVREEWIAWAKEQPEPKPSWLVPWEEMNEADKEVDRRIGEKLHRLAEARALVVRPLRIEPLTNAGTKALQFSLVQVGGVVANVDCAHGRMAIDARGTEPYFWCHGCNVKVFAPEPPKPS